MNEFYDYVSPRSGKQKDPFRLEGVLHIRDRILPGIHTDRVLPQPLFYGHSHSRQDVWNFTVVLVTFARFSASNSVEVRISGWI